MKASELRDMAKSWLRVKYPSALITHEFSVAEYGGALVDVAAVLPDQIIGVEIKGEADSHRRLALQGAMYSRVCRTMYLLACPTIQKACSTAKPAGWGELFIDERLRGASDYARCAVSGLMQDKYSTVDTSGYALAPVALAAMPWTKEYRAFQSALGMGLTTLPRTKSKCIEYVASNFSLRAIEKAVCTVLLDRDWELKPVDAGVA